MEMAESRKPDQVVTWRTYVLLLHQVCVAMDIPVPPNAEIEADFPERGSIRLTVKAAQE